MAAREAGNLTLAEALELVCLYAAAQDAKFERAAVKWLGRFIDDCSPSLLRAQIALAALFSFGEGARRQRGCCANFLRRWFRDALLLTKIWATIEGVPLAPAISTLGVARCELSRLAPAH